MKNLSRIPLLLACTLAASAALATGTYTPPPPPPPAPAPSTSTSTATSGSESSASSSSNATGGDSSASVGNTSATGGSVGNTSATASGGVGNGGSSRSSASSGDSYSASQSGDVMNKNTSQYLNFPQPVWTSVPTPYGCIVTESKSGAFGWNFVSGSGSKQFSDAVCTSVRMAEAAMLHCHFATAAYLNKAAFEQMYPGQKGDFFLDGKPQNLSPVACDELRRPQLRMVPVIQNPPTVTDNSQVNVMCGQPQTVRPQSSVVPKAKAKPQLCK